MEREDSGSADTMPIRLAFVEWRPIFAIGLGEVLERDPAIEILARPRSVREAIELLAGLDLDVLVIDFGVTGSVDEDLMERLRASAVIRAIVAIGPIHDDAGTLAAIELGAAAYLGENCEPDDLLAIIGRVARGQRPIRDDLMGRRTLVERLVEDLHESVLETQLPSHHVTARELEVLSLAAQGMRNADIAEFLGLREQMVKNHLTALFHKLGVRDRRHAIAYARRQGWLPEEAVAPPPTERQRT